MLYNEASSASRLRSAPFADGEPGEWKTVSAWLFDAETDKPADAESIANDFVDTVSAKKRTEIVQQARKEKAERRGQHLRPLFSTTAWSACSRSCATKSRGKKIEYGQVRPFAFAKERSCRRPSVSSRRTRIPRYVKFCALLGDMYANGDLDTRSVITIVLLNGLGGDLYNAIFEKLGDELKVTAAAAQIQRENGKTGKKRKRSANLRRQR